MKIQCFYILNSPYFSDDFSEKNDVRCVYALHYNYTQKHYIADDMNVHLQNNEVHNKPHYDDVYFGQNNHYRYKGYNYYDDHFHAHVHHEQMRKLAK